MLVAYARGYDLKLRCDYIVLIYSNGSTFTQSDVQKMIGLQQQVQGYVQRKNHRARQKKPWHRLGIVKDQEQRDHQRNLLLLEPRLVLQSRKRYQQFRHQAIARCVRWR